MNSAIKTAINIVGSQKKLGAACEVLMAMVTTMLGAI
ncbi:helix-turn-helix domain-containing protein [Escherichia coli]|nr:helix-turn-helix domain-containing protein [Escherichia coli]